MAMRIIEGRSADFLLEGAELKLDVKLPAVGGIPFDVWGPEKSLDQGRHRRVANPRSFGYDPYYARTPWKGGPEYMQWTVPEGFYTYVYALCADIPGTNTVSILGSSFGLLGPGANGENFAQAFTDLSPEAAASPLVEEECGLRYRSKLMTKANPDDFDEIGIWVRGNGSTGKVVLEIWGSDHPHRLEFPGRSVIAFDGWRLLRTKMPKVGPDKEGRRWFYPYGLSITNCRGALDPRDMRPVTEDMRFGNVVGIRLSRRPAASGPKEETWDAMKFVDEKDL